MKVKLYTTAGCHLCESALALLRRAQADGHAFRVCEVEIAGSEQLVDKYGIRIPVVVRDDAPSELGWPFTYEDLLQFLAS